MCPRCCVPYSELLFFLFPFFYSVPACYLCESFAYNFSFAVIIMPVDERALVSSLWRKGNLPLIICWSDYEPRYPYPWTLFLAVELISDPLLFFSLNIQAHTTCLTIENKCEWLILLELIWIDVSMNWIDLAFDECQGQPSAVESPHSCQWMGRNYPWMYTWEKIFSWMNSTPVQWMCLNITWELKLRSYCLAGLILLELIASIFISLVF